MQDYRSVGEILLDLARFEKLKAAGERAEATSLWAKLHLDDDAGQIEAFCKGRFGTFTLQAANRLCGEVGSHHGLSVYNVQRLPPSECIGLANDLPTVASPSNFSPQLVAPEPFVPTPLQRTILDALNGQALKKEPLAAKVCGGDDSRLYKPGGLKELKALGMVAHKHGVGYYRPDAPPTSP